MYAFQKRIEQVIVNLPFQYGLCFAASCCERLAPVFTAFSLIENWGNPKILKHGNDVIWRYLSGESFDRLVLSKLIAECETSVPIIDEVDFFLDISAMSACGAITETLRACLDKDATLLTIAGGCALDAVFDYVRVTSCSHLGPTQDYRLFLGDIEKAPLLLEEMAKQEEDVAALSSHPILDPSFLEQFRHSASTTGIQPFERGFVPERFWKAIYEPGLVPEIMVNKNGTIRLD